MFDPITAFHQKIGEPFGHWLHETGLELIAKGFATVFGLAWLAFIGFWVIDKVFGLGILGDSSGHCNGITGDCSPEP